MFVQVNETSIIVDASKYIEELKEKVDRLNQDLSSMQSPASEVSFPTVSILPFCLVDLQME